MNSHPFGIAQPLAMKFRPRKPKKTTETLRWVAIAALAIIALDSFFRLGFIFGPTFSRSNDVPTRKGASARSRVSFTDQTILPEKRQKGEVKGKDIVLVVGSDGHHPLDVHIREIKANREDYAAFHGYDFMWANLSDYHVNEEHAVWSKISVLLDAYQKYPEAEWIWWLDFDALIMTPTVDLGEYILNPNAMYAKLLKDQTFPIRHLGQSGKEELQLPAHPNIENINLLISHDQNGLNAGTFFLRRNKWTEMFLEHWHDPILMLEKDWWAHEQDALVHIFLHHHEFMKDHVGIVPQKEFNAYVPDDINRESLSKDLTTLKAQFWDSSALVIHFAGCWAHHNCEEWWNKFWPLREEVVDMEGRGWTLMLEDEAELNMVNAMENEPESEFIESYSNT